MDGEVEEDAVAAVTVPLDVVGVEVRGRAGPSSSVEPGHLYAVNKEKDREGGWNKQRNEGMSTKNIVIK
jgi:hypothetical protein